MREEVCQWRPLASKGRCYFWGGIGSMALSNTLTRLIVLTFSLALPFIIVNESAALTVIRKNSGPTSPTIAILDTALDTSLPIFEDRILFEACVTEWYSCPNGRDEMEGTNSATLPSSWYLTNGFSHGTQMGSLAVKTNPEVKIVFVRIIGATARGLRQISTETTVERALDWVVRNHKRFGIQAVSMSQGHHRLGAIGTDYCPKSPITQRKVRELLDQEVPVFFPTGNNGDKNRIDWPACIPESIAIASSTPAKNTARFSNFDPLLVDFYAPGEARVMSIGRKFINISGTSASTVIAATQWATLKSIHPELKYDEIYEILESTAEPINDSFQVLGREINLENALSVQLGRSIDGNDTFAKIASTIKSTAISSMSE